MRVVYTVCTRTHTQALGAHTVRQRRDVVVVVDEKDFQPMEMSHVCDVDALA